MKVTDFKRSVMLMEAKKDEIVWFTTVSTYTSNILLGIDSLY